MPELRPVSAKPAGSLHRALGRVRVDVVLDQQAALVGLDQLAVGQARDLAWRWKLCTGKWFLP